MSAVLYRAMLSKVKALLKVELTHTKKERTAQQWQLLFDIDDVKYLIGKGGINTTFYQVGDKERVICYPDDLLIFLESLLKKKYSSYAIYSKRKKQLVTGILTEDEALSYDAPVGSFIVGIADGKLVPLYKLHTGLMDTVWNKFKK